VIISVQRQLPLIHHHPTNLQSGIGLRNVELVLGDNFEKVLAGRHGGVGAFCAFS
jgi:hypothetical protein